MVWNSKLSLVGLLFCYMNSPKRYLAVYSGGERISGIAWRPTSPPFFVPRQAFKAQKLIEPLQQNWSYLAQNIRNPPVSKPKAKSSVWRHVQCRQSAD